MSAETLVKSSALLNGINFAVGLTSGKIRGVKVDTAHLAGGSNQPGDATMALLAMETSLLGGEVSRQTHDSIAAQIEGTGKNAQQNQNYRKSPEVAHAPDVGVIAGLLLGSPEFQRR